MKGWYAKTPPGFLFAAKVPQAITHERVLMDCDEDLSHFLKTMEALGEKLGPLLFQFGYFNKSRFREDKGAAVESERAASEGRPYNGRTQEEEGAAMESKRAASEGRPYGGRIQEEGGAAVESERAASEGRPYSGKAREGAEFVARLKPFLKRLDS